MLKNVLAGSAAIGFCMLAHADESNWRVYAAAGMSHGGDTIIAGNIIDTQTKLMTPFEVKAGTATEFRIGVDYQIIKRVTLQASIGHSDEAPMGTNGSLDFITTPVELLRFVNITDGLRVGGGLRKTSARMDGTGIASDWPGLGKYTGTRGSVAEVQYLFSTSGDKFSSRHNLFGLSLRSVHESFSHDAVTFTGNHYEVGGTYYY